MSRTGINRRISERGLEYSHQVIGSGISASPGGAYDALKFYGPAGAEAIRS